MECYYCHSGHLNIPLFPEYKELPSHTLQDVIARVEKAFDQWLSIERVLSEARVFTLPGKKYLYQSNSLINFPQIFLDS